ncbi:MAG: N-acetyltransferase [Nitrospirae bacterium]|nr:MAG: N-acetyltransferase [Nitrospirota bacterium]
MAYLSKRDLIIRRAFSSDLDVLTTFNTALAWETETRSLDPTRVRYGVQAVLDHPERGWYVVAEYASTHEVVGQTLVTFEWSDWRNATFWWLQSVYVRPQWRRRGVFRHLYQFVECLARKHSDQVAGIRLYVDYANLTAQTVYQALGFRPTSYQVYEIDFILSHPSL